LRDCSFLRRQTKKHKAKVSRLCVSLNKRVRKKTPDPPAHPQEEEQQPQALPSRVRNIAHHAHPQEILRQRAEIRKNFEERRRIATGGPKSIKSAIAAADGKDEASGAGMGARLKTTTVIHGRPRLNIIWRRAAGLPCPGTRPHNR
jgi:hypothetical protein